MASLADIIAGLNPPQREAVLHRGGPLLVLAGAGSGKTRVITVRMAHLIAEGTPPEHILALTFTNKAAGEMAERLAGLVGEDAAARVTVGTFHSLGLRMLEEEARHIGYTRRFTLLDAADQSSALRQCLRALRIDPRRHDPRMFLTAISNARNAQITPEQLAARPGSKLVAQVYAKYVEHLKAYQALDFDDLILRPIELLRDFPDLREKWRGRFRTVLVDEYQDTNGAQFEFTRLLVEEHRQLCVVGDDDQSIYGWRGAQVENILKFEEHFPDATAIRLEQNYRSTGHILKAANAVIARNTARKVKSLWTESDDGEPVRVVKCKDARAEASFIAAEIHRIREQDQRPFSHFGVLFRASSQAQPITDAFRLSGVPYRLVGAFDFFERKEVKDLLSYLKLVVNPSDRTSLMRVINFPQRGIGPASLSALYEFAEKQRISLASALSRAAEIDRLNRPQKEGMAALHDVLERARALWNEKRQLAGLARFIIAETGAREAWIRDPVEGPGGHGRWRSIERLLQSMENYQSRWVAKRKGDKLELRDYLRLVALDKHQTVEEEAEADEVTLMTMHAAKGLEWPVCFIVGCQEGYVPHQRTIDEAGDISEERRLFYVGITRARLYCFLTLARTRKRFQGSEPARPSRFLRDIPDAHREDIDRGRGGGQVDRSETKRRFAALRSMLSDAPE